MQRPFRLRDRADFARLRQSGRTLRHPLLLLSFAPNSLTHNRYGFIASKQIGNAVTRNRVRRRVRECVRLAASSLLDGYDVVWIARNGIGDQPYNKINEAVLELLHRARLVKPETPR